MPRLTPCLRCAAEQLACGTAQWQSSLGSVRHDAIPTTRRWIAESGHFQLPGHARCNVCVSAYRRIGGDAGRSMILAQIAAFIILLAVVLALLIAVLALVVVARWRSWRALLLSPEILKSVGA